MRKEVHWYLFLDTVNFYFSKQLVANTTWTQCKTSKSGRKCKAFLQETCTSMLSAQCHCIIPTGASQDVVCCYQSHAEDRVRRRPHQGRDLCYHKGQCSPADSGGFLLGVLRRALFLLSAGGDVSHWIQEALGLAGSSFALHCCRGRAQADQAQRGTTRKQTRVTWVAFLRHLFKDLWNLILALY